MKKMISFTLALLCVFGLAGCRNQPGPQEEVRTTVLPTADLSLTVSQSEDKKDPYTPLICTSTTWYDSDGKISAISQEAHDEENNIVFSKYSDPEFDWESVTEKQYDRKGNLIRQVDNSNGQRTTTLWEYNENGDEIREINYPSDGAAYIRHLNEYNQTGDRICSFWYNAEGNLESCTQYDAIGNLLSSVSYDDDGSLEDKDIWTYDHDGHTCTRTSYNGDGTIYQKINYEYDDNFTVTKSIYCSPDGSIKSTHEYDGSNIIKSIYYNPDGSIESTTEYEYNDDGDDLRSTSYDSDGTISSWEKYEYDENGNKISYVHYKGEELVGRYEYQYDQNGRKILYNDYEYGSCELVYTEKTEYDDAGNVSSVKRYDASGELILRTEYAHYQTNYLNFFAEQYTQERSSVELTAEAEQYIQNLLNNAQWREDTGHCETGYFFNISGRLLIYHELCGTFRDPQSKQSTWISPEERWNLNILLGVDRSLAPSPYNQYNVEVIDPSGRIHNRIASSYAAGQTVIVKLSCPTEHVLNVYVNGVQMPLNRKSYHFPYLVFTMPCEDIRIETKLKYVFYTEEDGELVPVR